MNQKILNILKVVGFCLLVVDLEAQQASKLSEFSSKKYKLNRKGMTILTGWASINILSGSGYFVSKAPTEKYFYAMNAGWGAVNLAIAVPALLSKEKQYSSKDSLLKDQIKTEKVFFVNAVLDVVYIAAGITMKEITNSQTDATKKALLNGFGNSFIVQGLGLLVFDLSMFHLNKQNRKLNLKPILQNSEISINPKGFQYKLNF